MPKKPYLLIVSIVISQLAGIIGSLATSKSVSNWYITLDKPFFNPPNWLFGPVWLTLYTLMGIAMYLIWIKQKKKEKTPTSVIVFFVHLIFNTLWSIVFFGLQNPGLAVLVIVILLLMILYLIKTFYNSDKRAAYLLVPYALWVSYATILNISIWILN